MGAKQNQGAPLESQLASEVAELIRDVEIGANVDIRVDAALGASLELYVPALLRKRFLEWEKESLDGVLVTSARKATSSALELYGTCILISDQCVTPLFVRVEVDLSGPKLRATSVRLGEKGGGPLGISGPKYGSRAARRLRDAMDLRVDSVDWVYRAEAGNSTSPGS